MRTCMLMLGYIGSLEAEVSMFPGCCFHRLHESTPANRSTFLDERLSRIDELCAVSCMKVTKLMNVRIWKRRRRWLLL